MFYLLESPIGIALFKRTQDDITMLKSLAFDESTDTPAIFHSLNSGDLPESVISFISENCTAGSTINVLNPQLSEKIKNETQLNGVCEPDEYFRKIRTNSFKYFGTSKNTNMAATAKLAHRLASTGRDDMIVVDLLNCVEEMDVSINNRVMRMREWYSIHFPELNVIADNMEYLQTVIRIGNRKGLETDGEIEKLAKNSMGSEMKEDDIEKIKEDINGILRDVEHKNSVVGLLKMRIQRAFPNLYNLAGESITARLLRKAGSISRLAQMPSSTVQILGAEKAFNEAVKAKSNTPKHGLIFNHSFISGSPEHLRGRIARVFANKISLCARVDSENQSGDFGATMKKTIEKLIEKMIENGSKEKKIAVKNKKRIISVTEYDVSRDSTKRSKTAD